ncbi:MAG: DNA topoisomerase I [Candidatus Caldarchaeum sp.]|nr:DNA topoisomerase I [Candidatus Caldarchaeum sp.]
MAKWRTLVHNGVAVPPPYQPKGLSIIIRGEKVRLSPLQEEMAYAWALKKDTPYVQDPVFQKNFLSDFLKTFDGRFEGVSMDEIDFSEVFAYVERERQLKADKEYRKRLSAERKKLREELKARYGWAEMDGKKFEVANWMVEPPGIFMGRGAHPLRGRWKPRIYEEDITLNLGEDAPIPPGNWGQIVHDHDSMWLARWNDKLTDKEKYVWLSDTADIKQKRDRMKYDKAMVLENHIEDVRRKILQALNSEDPKMREIALACYLIDRLAMRVGDEKDPDEADTVGATTLRVEHVKLSKDRVEFDFLGKDSVRWQKSIDLKTEPQQVFQVFKELLNGKREGEQIFQNINSRHVNRFLGKMVKGLTAKVFRTYLATKVVKDFLLSVPREEITSEERAVYYAKLANLRAAEALNHKRAPPKNWDSSVLKKEERVRQLMERMKEAKSEKQRARAAASLEKARLALDLYVKVKDYNLATSLRNYIDPRVYKAWGKAVKLDWRKIYTAALLRKFRWVEKAEVKRLVSLFAEPKEVLAVDKVDG